jgi:polygalacturonase
MAADSAWASMSGILQRIVPPKFPERNFDITQYGAIGDGVASCTAAFQAAIAACNKAGGGRVLVPKGKFFTGPIHF